MSIRQADGAKSLLKSDARDSALQPPPSTAPYETRWGDGWVYVRDGRLIGVDLPGEGPLAEASAAGAAGRAGAPGSATEPAGGDGPGADDAEALAFWARELTSYFAGERTTWTAGEVPLAHLGLGAFEQTVYEALLSIPAGETVSYGELAEMAGIPGRRGPWATPWPATPSRWWCRATGSSAPTAPWASTATIRSGNRGC